MKKLFINRRQFIKTSAAATLLGTAGIRCNPPGEKDTTEEPTTEKDIDASTIPRWRGFNLLEKFIATRMNDPFRESDFEWMAEWGFDFVRLPMSYWCWSDPNDWKQLKEKPLKEIDQAVEFGKQYGVHVSLNFHRAPGFSVDRSAEEPFNLWKDEEAQEAFDYHWSHFAERYKGIPNKQVSFNLVNEPSTLTSAREEPVPVEIHDKVMRRVVKAIRDVDPNRLIIADGLWWARNPIPSLADLDIVQSTRGYEPMQITHYGASWVHGGETWPEPAWPLDQVEAAELRWASDNLKDVYKQKLKSWGVDWKMQWNRERLKMQLIDPWKQLQDMGVRVHVGEFGAFSRTPHDVVLGWMRDLLSLWKEAGWGWAMWNLRGSFGIVDSQRNDVAYEDFKRHKLDREMLELLKEF